MYIIQRTTGVILLKCKSRKDRNVPINLSSIILTFAKYMDNQYDIMQWYAKKG